MWIMNKIIMVIWGTIIVLLCTILFLIGLKLRDNEYLAFEANLKKTVLTYVKKSHKMPKFSDCVVVYSDELIEKELVKEEDLNKYCIKRIILKKGLLMNEYEFEKECEKEE